MKIAAITFSKEGAKILSRIARGIDGADIFVHRGIPCPEGATPFERILDLTAEIFTRYDGLVYVGPCGIAVRAIAPLIKHKLTDPAVVCVDVRGRFAVSLLSGHEGGANDLAVRVANLTGAEPVISTTTEALKNLVVGVGCRKGKPAEEIAAAIRTALDQIGASVDQVRLLATADVKGTEVGLIKAAESLNIPLRILDSQQIRQCALPFEHSDFVNENVNLPAVAEPAALLAGRRTELILQKTAFGGITVAIARENSFSSASDPDQP